MVISITKVSAPKEALDRMAEGFKHAAPQMQAFPGCIGFELWRSEDTLEAISRWESRDAIKAYEQSDLFTAHHPGMAAGRSMPGQVEVYDAETLF